MRFAHLFRVLSPELLFGLFQVLLWLLLAVEVSVRVVAPLAEAFAGPLGA